MKSTRSLLQVLIAGVTISATAQNLLINGDFSQGNVGFTSGYAYSPGNLGPASTYDTVANPETDNIYGGSIGDHTTGSGLMLALNGSPNANTVVWSETINVMSGGIYQFSGWDASWGAYYGPIDNSPANLQIEINGQQAGSAIPVNPNDGHWQNFNISWTSSSTQANIQIFDMNLASSGNDFALDDLSFQAVPESSSAALLCLAAILFSIRRLWYSGIIQSEIARAGIATF